MSRPLHGVRILVTRPPGQAGRLSRALEAEGAVPIGVPAIAIVPPDDWGPVDAAIARGAYDWVIFTSANGVRSFVGRLRATGRDASWFHGARTAAIGPETARTLASEGVKPDLVPEDFVAEALVACVADAGPLAARRILLPRAEVARDTLVVGLTREGAIVEPVVAYRTLPAPPPPDLLPRLRAGEVDAVTFTSSSTVHALLDVLGGDPELLASTVVACIGPITAATARERGLAPEVVARTYTIDGLVTSLRDYFAARPAADRRTQPKGDSP